MVKNYVYRIKQKKEGTNVREKESRKKEEKK